ncbi:MAG: DUF1501 domain-containing protein [Bacteroidia bacterium]|nr:DUF1501 domain-containing protein [Bacteroidia bacterium]NNM16229.1 DUF1501 domain-containing protein [Bacteroidia bacterium]
MDRRKFIMSSSVLSASLMLPKFISCSPNNLTAQNTNGKRLIVIQLAGGNDGLNTFIPYQNDIYYKSRPFIGITKNEAFKLTDDMGLHPKMEGLKKLYDEGLVSVINSVGYPNPNRSHFRSMDIWQSASGSDEYLDTGWIGRYLDSDCPSNCKNSLDAIEIDDSLSLAMKGDQVKGMSFKDAKLLYENTNHTYIKALSSHASEQRVGADNSLFLHKVLTETVQNADYIFNKSKTYKSTVNYPQSMLSKQLKTIGQLIGSGSSTSVYYASHGGFDTHVGQNGKHGRLLNIYSDAVSALVQDLKNTDNLKDTIILTFSEFGRRVTQNASRGTDHGTANNVTIIGGSLKNAGFYNDTPDLRNLDNNDLKYQVDFRSVYSTVLSNWLGADSNKILGSKFKALDIV